LSQAESHRRKTLPAYFGLDKPYRSSQRKQRGRAILVSVIQSGTTRHPHRPGGPHRGLNKVGGRKRFLAAEMTRREAREIRASHLTRNDRFRASRNASQVPPRVTPNPIQGRYQHQDVIPTSSPQRFSGRVNASKFLGFPSFSPNLPP